MPLSPHQQLICFVTLLLVGLSLLGPTLLLPYVTVCLFLRESDILNAHTALVLRNMCLLPTNLCVVHGLSLTSLSTQSSSPTPKTHTYQPMYIPNLSYKYKHTYAYTAWGSPNAFWHITVSSLSWSSPFPGSKKGK